MAASVRYDPYDPRDHAVFSAAGPGTLSFYATRALELPQQFIVSEKYTVMFRTNGDTLDVRISELQSSSRPYPTLIERAHFVDIVAVAFYPLPVPFLAAHIPEDVFSTEYVMSLWQRDALRPIDHPLLHFRDAGDPVYQEDLTPVGRGDRVLAALRFSMNAVNRSADLSWNPNRRVVNLWAAELGWNVALHRSPQYLVASRPDNISALEADISALEAAMMPEDKKHIAAWRCPACLEGTKEDSKLVAAHAKHVDLQGNNVWHVFHRDCLRAWRAKPQFEDRTRRR